MIARERRELAGPLRGAGGRGPGPRWSEWFEGLQVDGQGGETVLSGTLADQSALHGVLDKVCDLGLSIITVRRLPPGPIEEGPP